MRLLRLLNRSRILNSIRSNSYAVPCSNVKRFLTASVKGAQTEEFPTKHTVTDDVEEQFVPPEELSENVEENGTNYDQVIDELNQKVGALEKKLKELELKYKFSLENNDHLCRTYKKEIENVKQYAITDFARNMLDVADTFELAFKHMKLEDESDSIKEFINGIKLTESMLHNTFDKFGVKRYDSLMEQFNPEIHEAMFEIDDPENRNRVLQVILNGYKINNRVLRPAKVGVARK